MESSGGVEREDFLPVGSCFSRCSSATNMEAFLSVMTKISQCSSLSCVEYLDLQSHGQLFWAVPEGLYCFLLCVNLHLNLGHGVKAKVLFNKNKYGTKLKV